jgi:transposase
MSAPELTINVERLDDMPLLYGFLEKMGIQSAIDTVIKPHGNWQGLSMGWVVTIWLIHITSVYNHRMDRVQGWVADHLTSLKQLTGQEITEMDFTDDRLAICLRELHEASHWGRIEALLGNRLLRVYQLKKEKVVRLDATVGGVYHDPQQHKLFQVGKNKQGEYETQFKLMLASLDPLGLLLAIDVAAGNRADDPLYVPCYQRVKEMLARNGLLIVGDSKMSAMSTRTAIVAGNDHYLTPLPHEKSEPGLLDELLSQFQVSGESLTSVFLPEDLPEPDDDREPDPALAIAEGFEVSRKQSEIVGQDEVNWDERCLFVRSFNYQQAMQAGLERRLAKAEKALVQLTPARGRGKRQISDEKSLQQAIARIEKQYKVAGLFRVTYTQEVSERKVRAYRGQPPRIDRKVRFQVQVERNQEAIEWAMFKAGWRIYLTNAPQKQLSLTEAVLAYRDQYIEENIFRRLKGKMLSITPLYVQRDDHAQGLFHLLSLAARLLALGDYTARQALAEQQAELSGIYPGNPKRSTPRPTMERMLEVFDNINLSIVHLAEQTLCQVTPLTAVQERILSLLGLPITLYTDWTVA